MRVGLVMLVLLVGCGSGDPVTEVTSPTGAAYSAECGQAVEGAASVSDMEDAVDDLDPAIAVCTDLDELSAAVDDFPDALDGADVEGFVSNRCLYSEDDEVLSSSICDSVE